MKIYHSFIIAFLCFATSAAAQGIISELETQHDSSEGVISVSADPAINALLGTPNGNGNNIYGNNNSADNQSVPSYDGETTTTKVSGFRIQIYMGNDPKNSRSEAAYKQQQVREVFDEDVATYIEYKSPNWKVFVGDFQTREEANLFKAQLQKKIPKLKEMFIVAAQINVPVKKTY